MSHATLHSIDGLLGKVKSLIEIQEEVIVTAPKDLVSGGPLATRIITSRAELVVGIQTSKCIEVHC